MSLSNAIQLIRLMDFLIIPERMRQDILEARTIHENEQSLRAFYRQYKAHPAVKTLFETVRYPFYFNNTDGWGYNSSIRAIVMPDDNTLFNGLEDGTITVLRKNMATKQFEVGQCLGEAPQNRNDNSIYALAATPDGNTLFSGSRDKSTMMWTTETLEQHYQRQNINIFARISRGLLHKLLCCSDKR